MAKAESFKVAVEKTVEDYNKYRSPEAAASLIEISDKELTIDFAGSFCLGCGIGDHFEDFIYEVKGYTDVEMATASFEQTEPEKFRVKFIFRIVKLP